MAAVQILGTLEAASCDYDSAFSIMLCATWIEAHKKSPTRPHRVVPAMDRVRQSAIGTKSSLRVFVTALEDEQGETIMKR